MAAYYNEIDPNAAAWLRELIVRGLIAPGDVDTRSIVDVRPDDLVAYDQCHFFAGIGVWSHALRSAGWRDDRPVWTGSCPCQPFSAAGKGGGFDDSRHLWPDFFRLIRECRPDVVLGEQVASKDGLSWLDLVCTDLEGADYAVGAVDTCAAGFGAPHIRQRLYWCGTAGRASGVEDTNLPTPERQQSVGGADLRQQATVRLGRRSVDDGLDLPRARAGLLPEQDSRLADADGGNARAEGLQRGGQHGQQPQDGGAGGMGNPAVEPCERFAGGFSGTQAQVDRKDGQQHGGQPVGPEYAGSGVGERPGPTNGWWATPDWLHCRDGKWRPVEPGTFPLAHGATARVGRLRGYGNAIVAPQARAFVEAVMSCD